MSISDPIIEKNEIIPLALSLMEKPHLEGRERNIYTNLIIKQEGPCWCMLGQHFVIDWWKKLAGGCTESSDQPPLLESAASSKPVVITGHCLGSLPWNKNQLLSYDLLTLEITKKLDTPTSARLLDKGITGVGTNVFALDK